MIRTDLTPPILLLVFRRPKETKLVLDSIRQVKPKKLYIGADGPRANHQEDIEKCMQVREIVSQIDWDCEVFHLYRRENLGLEKAVSSSITWFFSHENEGIILEDDCVADPSYFAFAARMLAKYRHDERVMAINASTFLPESMQNQSRYYFSRYPHFWGWASWKRAWMKYDGEMQDWPKIKAGDVFKNRYQSKWHKAYFEMIFEATYLHTTNSWGYRWFYSVWKNQGISITPPNKFGYEYWLYQRSDAPGSA